MSGEQKTKVEKLEELSEGRTSGWLVKAKLREENAALKEALAELIPIADYYHDREVTYTGMPYKTWNDIIDRAKKLLNKQPQSESDGDKNLS